MPNLPKQYVDQVNWTDCREVWDFGVRNQELEGLWPNFFVGTPPDAYVVRQAMTGKIHGELLGTAAQASAKCLKVVISNDCLYNMSRHSRHPLSKAVSHCGVSPNGYAIEINSRTQTIDFFQNRIGWNSWNRARFVVGRAFGRWGYQLLPLLVVESYESLVPKGRDLREDFAAIFAAEVFGFGQEMTAIRKSDNSSMKFDDRRKIVKGFIERMSRGD